MGSDYPCIVSPYVLYFYFDILMHLAFPCSFDYL